MKKTFMLLVLGFVLITGFSIRSEAEEQISESEIPNSAVLTQVVDLGDTCYLYEYTDVATRSIGAKQASKYLRIMMAGEEAAVIKCMVSFSYGHDDGVVRMNKTSYQIIKVDAGWGVSIGGVGMSTQNGQIGKGIFNINYNANGESKTAQLIIYCKNNGGYY